MSFSAWLRSRTSIRSPRSRAQQRPAAGRFRPQLDVLEGRWLPSTLTVTNNLDIGHGSLRYEIAHAHNRDIIVFAPDIHTITLHGNDLLITAKNLTIKGPGADQLTVTTDYFSDSPPYGYYGVRIFEVAAGSVATISGLTLNNGTGRANGNSPSPNDYKGGAILNSGTLTVSGCTVTGNEAGYGGGIYNTGTLTVNSCTFYGNYADPYLGGDNHNIYNAGTLTVTDSLFDSLGIFGTYTDGGGNTILTRPHIGSFTSSSSSVPAGSSLTLTATDISDANPGASTTEVMIGLNDPYTAFGYATQTSPGVWTWTVSTAGWAPGTYTFYATAWDNYGESSVAVAITVQVI
jgi:hypothetical protein